MKRLVVEDEKELLYSIAEGLRLSGYAVDTASDGEAAEEMCAIGNYDLIVLDINLPKVDGFTVLKRIREENKLVNVIMLTARTGLEDRVKGLDLGANDYLIKPFYFMKNKTAFIGDERLKLTGKETGILEYLLINQGRYVSQEELLEHVWDDGVNEFSNAVRVHVSALRNKLKAALGKNIIKNEIGRGYIIDKEQS